MGLKQKIDFLRIDFSFVVFASAVLLLVPLRLTLAWALAILIHELSHYCMLRLCGVSVHSIRLCGTGVVMNTAAVTNKQELLCAIAGPVGGLSLLFVARWLPCTAICAFIQSCYNLIPIFPLDGGRALRCVLIKMFGYVKGEKISNSITYIIVIVLAVLTVYIIWKFGMNVLTLSMIVFVVFKFYGRKIPCKHNEQIVQ